MQGRARNGPRLAGEDAVEGAARPAARRREMQARARGSPPWEMQARARGSQLHRLSCAGEGERKWGRGEREGQNYLFSSSLGTISVHSVQKVIGVKISWR